jgi:hypothetical protein
VSVTRTRVIALVIGVVGYFAGPSACRQLYSGPPVVRDRHDRDDVVTKRVRAKREPDRLIAEDLSVCWVIPEVYEGIKPGDHWRCAWRHIPGGQ